MVALGNRVSEQLSRLGIPAEAMGAQLQGLSTEKLSALSGGLQVALGTGEVQSNKFLGDIQDSRWNIAPALHNPTPKASLQDRASYIRGSYFRPRVRRHASAQNPFPGLLNRFTKDGVIVGRKLQRDRAARATFERNAQLRFVPDGRTDGAVSVHAMNGGGGGSPGAGMSSFYDMFQAMDQAVMAEAARLGNVAMAGAEMYGDPAYNAVPGPAGYFGGMGGDGQFGSSTFGGGYGESMGIDGESTDELVFRIKRMMDKRNQLYDLFKNVLDKHNESAKTAIGNLRA